MSSDPFQDDVAAIAQNWLDCRQRVLLLLGDHCQVKDIARCESIAAVLHASAERRCCAVLVLATQSN